MTHLDMPQQIHATAVAIDSQWGLMGVLLLGPSGAGKSDLALRLIDRGARLIADDRVDLAADGARIMLSVPERIAGMMEVRGLGILRFNHVTAPLALCVELVGADAVERLPEPDGELFLGRKVPLVRLHPFELSAPIKVELAARRAPHNVSDHISREAC